MHGRKGGRDDYGEWALPLFSYTHYYMELLYIGQQQLIKKCRILRHTNINYVLSYQNSICSYFIDLGDFKAEFYSIAHFYDKLLLLKDRMHTNIGKQIALSRHKFMQEYLIQFYKEWNLEDLE